MKNETLKLNDLPTYEERETICICGHHDCLHGFKSPTDFSAGICKVMGCSCTGFDSGEKRNEFNLTQHESMK